MVRIAENTGKIIVVQVEITVVAMIMKLITGSRTTIVTPIILEVVQTVVIILMVATKEMLDQDKWEAIEIKVNS